MAAKISDVAAGLRQALKAIQGLRVVEYLPDQVNPPTAVMSITDVTFHRAFSGGDPVYQFVVTLIVARTSDRIAQDRLDAYASFDGPQSVRAAIEADQTLDGACQSLVVDRVGNIQTVTLADNVNYLAVDFTVIVHA